MNQVLHTVGFAVALEAFDYSVPQEFAGASATVRVPAGRYPVQIRSSQGYSAPHTYVGVQLAGVLVRTTWHGTNSRVEEPNAEATPFDQMYLYEVEAALRGEPRRRALKFELAEGYSIGEDGRLFHGTDRLRVSGV